MTDRLGQLKLRMEALGISPKEFARLSGVAYPLILNIERHDYRNTTNRTDRKIFSTLEYLEAKAKEQSQ